MIIIVDDREMVKQGYVNLFDREGVVVAGFGASEFNGWVDSISRSDADAIEAFLIGDCESRDRLTQVITQKTIAAVIAMNDKKSLDDTLQLFSAGVDDVVEKPVHVRELLARIAAISRRKRATRHVDHGRDKDIFVFPDGRDPLVNGEALALPRRERKILEYLYNNAGRRMSKAQIFNSVYGLFDQSIDEIVIESHISKLRKRLRSRLGYDPIDCKRHLGYRLTVSRMDEK